VSVRLERGRLGRFDVLVDGEIVAQRARGDARRAPDGGWPDPEAVVTAIETAIARAHGRS
jgi:hypothetical protein